MSAHPAFVRVIGALAAVALLGACVEGPVAPSPRALATSDAMMAVTGGPDLSDWHSFEGEVWICKDGNLAGVPFNFDWTVDDFDTGANLAAGTTAVEVGRCVMVVHLDTVARNRAHVSVTEQAPPANWAFSGVAYDHGNFPGPVEVPVIDLAARSIADVHAGNDVGVQITFTNLYTPPAPACTYTQGFWKTHQELWDTPAEMVIWNGALFFNAGITYAEVFDLSVAGGNSYVKLAHQYMAAKLNVNFGADPTIDAAIAQAEAYFAGHPAGSTYIKDAAWNTLAGMLDAYNNGYTGPGHCPD